MVSEVLESELATSMAFFCAHKKPDLAGPHGGLREIRLRGLYFFFEVASPSRRRQRVIGTPVSAGAAALAGPSQMTRFGAAWGFCILFTDFLVIEVAADLPRDLGLRACDAFGALVRVASMEATLLRSLVGPGLLALILSAQVLD